MPDLVSSTVPGRACNGCTMCCKLVGVEALNKQQGEWCQHCDVGVGCRIYEDRPQDCRTFYCGFLQLPYLTEEWRPSKCKIVLVGELGGSRLAAYVDASRPNAWRSEPYYSQLKHWAIEAEGKRREVIVCDGNRTTVILPHKDVDLGIVADDELIVTEEVHTPFGPKYVDAKKIKRDDPRAARVINPGIAET